MWNCSLLQAAAKQRQEEEADDQANKISNEIDKLERRKQEIQDKIEGQHRHIDGCTAEMRKLKCWRLIWNQ